MDSAAAVRPHVPALNFPTSERSTAARGTHDQRVDHSIGQGNNGTIPTNSKGPQRSPATPHTPQTASTASNDGSPRHYLPRTYGPQADNPQIGPSREGLGGRGAREDAGVGPSRGSPRLDTKQTNGTPRNAWQGATSGNTTARSYGNPGNTTARTNASSNHHHKSNHTRSKKSKKNSSFFVRLARSIYTLRYPLIFVGAAYGGAPLHRLCLEYAHFYTYREHNDLVTSPNSSKLRDASTPTNSNNSITNKTTSTSSEVPPRSRLEHWAADARGDIVSPVASTIGAVMRALGIPTLGDLRARQQVHSSLATGRASGHGHGKSGSEATVDCGDGADSEVISAIPIAVIVPLLAVVAIVAARYVLVKPLTPPPPPPLPPLQPTYPPTDDDEMGNEPSQFYRPRAAFGNGGSFHGSRNEHSPPGGGGEDDREEGRFGGDGRRGHRSAFNKENTSCDRSSHREGDYVGSGSGVGTHKSSQDAPQPGGFPSAPHSHNNHTAADEHTGGQQKRSADASDATTPSRVTPKEEEEEECLLVVDDAISVELGSAPSNETDNVASNICKKADDGNTTVATNGGDGDEPREVQHQTTAEVSVSRGTACDSDPSDGHGDQGIRVGEGEGNYPIILTGAAQSDSDTEWEVGDVGCENVPQTAAIGGDTVGVSVSSLSTSSVPLPSPSSLAPQLQPSPPPSPQASSPGQRVVLVPSSRRSSVGFKAVEKALRLNSARNRQPSVGDSTMDEAEEEAPHEVGNASSAAASDNIPNATELRSILPPPPNTERRIDWDTCGPSIERDERGRVVEKEGDSIKGNGVAVATTTTTDNRHDLTFLDRDAPPSRTALMSVLHRRRLREPDDAVAEVLAHEKPEVPTPTSTGTNKEVTGPTVAPANTHALLKAIRLNSLSNRFNTTRTATDESLLRDGDSEGQGRDASLRRDVALENATTNTDDSPLNSDTSSRTAPPADGEKMMSSTSDIVGEETRAEDEGDVKTEMERTHNTAQVVHVVMVGHMRGENSRTPESSSSTSDVDRHLAVINASADRIGAPNDKGEVEKSNTEVDGDGAASSSSNPNTSSKKSNPLTAGNTSTGSPSSLSTPTRSDKGNDSSATTPREPPVQASTRIFTHAGVERGEGSDRLQRLKAVLSANAKQTSAGSPSGRGPLLVKTPNRVAPSNFASIAASQRNVSDSPTHASSEAGGEEAGGEEAGSSVGPISSGAPTSTSTPSRLRDADEGLLENEKRALTDDTNSNTNASLSSVSAVVILALAVPSSIVDVVGLLREAKRHKVRRVVIPKTHDHFVLVRDHDVEEAKEAGSKGTDNNNSNTNNNNGDQNSRPHVIRVPRGVDVEEVTNVRQFCKAASSIISTVAVHRDVSSLIGHSSPNTSSHPYLSTATPSATTSSENTNTASTTPLSLPRRGASFYRGTTKYTALQWFNHPFNGIYVFETRQVPEAGLYTVEVEKLLKVSPITKEALVLEPRKLEMIVSDGPLAWCDFHVYVDTTAAGGGVSSSSPSMGSSPLRSFNFPHSSSAPQSPNSHSGRGSEGGLIDESPSLSGNANEMSLPLSFFINLALYHRTVKPPRPPSDSSASIVEDTKATGGYRSPLKEPRLRVM